MKNNINFNIEIIIEEYSSYVFKIINNIVGTSLPYQDKEEIAADVFYLLWKNQNNINENIKSYIGTIARNCSYRKLKDTKINLELKEELISDNQSKVNDDLYAINDKIKELKEDERKIFTLYYVNGYKVKEISKTLKISSSSVKIKLYRIRKKLKEDLL